MIGSFFQLRLSQLGLDIEVKDRIWSMLKRNSENAAKQFLIKSSESWDTRGKVTECLLEGLKDKVKLNFSEYQEMLADLKNAKVVKSTLKANIFETQDNLNTHKGLLECLIDYRRPLFYDLNENIGFYAKEKESFNEYIEDIKKVEIGLRENIRNLKLNLRKLKNLIECHEFLVQYFSESFLYKRKDKFKSYSIKVFNTKNKMKSEEKLRVKSKITVKPQIFKFKNELFDEQTTHLLESPISSNNSHDSCRSD